MKTIFYDTNELVLCLENQFAQYSIQRKLETCFRSLKNCLCVSLNHSYNAENKI